MIHLLGVGVLGLCGVAGPLFEERRLLPLGPDDQRMFGFVSAVGDGLVAVGTPLGNADPGQGFVEVFDAESGARLYRLGAGDVGGGDFGAWSLAFAGDALLVGVPSPGLGLDEPSGRVYVFGAADGAYRATIVPPDERSLLFGWSMAVDGGRVLIGAPDRTFDRPDGAAYLYEIGGTEPLRVFEPPEGVDLGTMGYAVAIEDGRAAVAARRGTTATGWNGAVVVFDAETGEPLETLGDPRADAQRIFGHAIALDDGVLAVGSAYQPFGASGDVGLGWVSVFGVDDGALLGVLDAPDAEGFGFGSSVALGGGVLLVGARDDSGRAVSGGGAWAFEVGTMLPITGLGPAMPGHLDRFGWSVSLGSGRAWVGAPFYEATGAVYGFVVPERCVVDFDGDRRATTADVGLFVDLFRSGHAAADVAEPRGVFDFFDVAEFVRLYGGGCVGE
jgi:outer membrane protein assembly factor BamB